MGSSPFEDELVVCVISVGVDGDSVDIIEIGLTPPVEQFKLDGDANGDIGDGEVESDAEVTGEGPTVDVT